MNDPMKELERLVEARGKATEGEWEHQHSPANYHWNRVMPMMRWDNLGFTPECEGEQLYFKNADDCAFIALAGSLDLPTILEAWKREREAIDIAIGALSDIASADDMTLTIARKKARRIAGELRTLTPKGTQ